MLVGRGQPQRRLQSGRLGPKGFLEVDRGDQVLGLLDGQFDDRHLFFDGLGLVRPPPQPEKINELLIERITRRPHRFATQRTAEHLVSDLGGIRLRLDQTTD